MNDDEPCEDEPLPPMERVWRAREEFKEKIARYELLTLSDISFKYGVSLTEILPSPELRLYYLRWLLPKKEEVDAFLKENKTERINKDE
jgi:hypothetical protein